MNNANKISTNIIAFILIGLIVLVSLFAFNIIPNPFNDNIVSEVSFKEKRIRLKNKSSAQLSLTSSNGNIKYKSSDESIATVNEYTGYVTGVNNGTVTITAYVDGSDVKDECVIEVYTPTHNIEITKLTLSSTNLNLYVGNTKQLKVSISPSNATNKKIYWSTSNKDVATIDKNGNVKGVGIGTAKIKVRTDNGVYAICNITVSKKSTSKPTPLPTPNPSPTPTTKTYTLTYNANGGNVSPTSKTLKEGELYGSLPTPSRNGYKFAGWYTQASGGSAVSANTTIKSNTTIYAHWNQVSSSPTKNKTALFIGDSITYGKDGHYSWANYIGEKYDLKKTVNAGLSGGVFSSFRGELWLVDVAKQHKGESYDYVIMHGGINDIAMVAKRGEPKGSYTANNFSGNYDTNTFIGGLETYIYTVKKQWPNAKIGYIINYRTPADAAVDPISNEYYTLIKQVCNKWGIKYIDLYSGKTSSGQAYSDLLKVNTKTYISDGIHLNRDGYNVISPHIYNWMKTL